MKNFNTNTKNEEEWLTPPYIVKALGDFDLDPCAQPESRRVFVTAKNHYSKEENGDGLALDWYGRVWLNPPYGSKTFKWLKKLADHGSGIALIFARTETKGFHREVWQKANAVFFFEGRIKFFRSNGEIGNCANAPSCLVSYSDEDTLAIAHATIAHKLKGKILYVNKILDYGLSDEPKEYLCDYIKTYLSD